MSSNVQVMQDLVTHISQLQLTTITNWALGSALSLENVSAFEKSVSADYADIRLKCEVHDTVGTPIVNKTRRAQYVPVRYVYPLQGNAQALCYDLSSNPVREKAILIAGITGDVVASYPVNLVQGGYGVLLSAGVNSGTMANSTASKRPFDAYVFGVLNIDNIVKNALTIVRQKFVLAVYAVSPDTNITTVYSSWNPTWCQEMPALLRLHLVRQFARLS